MTTTHTGTPATTGPVVKIYRAYKGIPTQNSHWMRTVATVAKAEEFYGLYEGQEMAIVVYTDDGAGNETLVYASPSLGGY